MGALARPAGALRRSSYATSAVGATVLALVALLGVSVVVARQGGDGRGAQQVAGLTASDRSLAGDGRGSEAGAAGASSASNGSGARNGRSGLGAGGAAAGGGLGGAAGGLGGSSAGGGSGTGAGGSGTATDPGASAAGGSSAGAGSGAGAGGSGTGSAGSGSGGTGTAGSGSGTVAASPDDPPTTMAVETAEPGGWALRVESRAGGVLLDDDSGDSRFFVGDATSERTQRFDAAGGPALGMFGAYTARVVSQGRYLTELELRGEPGRRFVAAVPVLDVPSTWRPGDRWSWRLVADDGKTTLDATSSVVGRDHVTLADGRTQVETVRVDSTYVLGGDRSVTVTRKLWFSPSLGVPVRVEERSSGTDQSGRSAARDATMQLAATEPGSASTGGVVPRP